MAKLDFEACMTIKTLKDTTLSRRELAPLLGVTEGAVRYQIRKLELGDTDGRSSKAFIADEFSGAITTGVLR